MGRCYEFGLAIHQGCEQTMVVPDEGGKCICEGCGAQCLGRFAACAEIISTPGYLPPLAPAWAHPGAGPPPPPEVGSANGKPAPTATPTAGASAEASPQRQTEREKRLVERNRGLTASLARLRAVVEEVKSEVSGHREALEELTGQLAEQRQAVEHLTAVAEDLRARLAAYDAKAAGAPRSIWRRP